MMTRTFVTNVFRQCEFLRHAARKTKMRRAHRVHRGAPRMRVAVPLALLLGFLAAPAPSQAQSGCQQSLAIGSWLNQALAAQTAPFTATYDATPGQAPMDGSVGF